MTVGHDDPCETSVPGSETCYDPLGRVQMTRRWSDVTIPLAGIIVDSNLIGKTNTLTYYNVPNWTSGYLLSETINYYDRLGRIWKTETEDEDGVFQPTYYEYDKAGKQTAVINALQKRTEYEYEGNRKVLMRDARTNETRFVHEVLGRIVETIFHDETYTYSDYDELGRRVGQVDQAGLLRLFDYDKAGRLTAVILPEVIDPNNNDQPTYPRYEYEYDQHGNLIKITDNLKMDPDTDDVNDLDARVTEFTYNELGQQVSRKLPDGQIEYKYYDANGLLIKAVDFKGQVRRYDYDDANAPGRLSSEKYYDSNDTPENDPNLIIEIIRDRRGRTERVDINDIDNGKIAKWRYWYDEFGRVKAMMSPTQRYLAYEYYGSTGRRKSVYAPKTSALQDYDTKVSYGYDPLGRLEKVQVDKRNGISPADEITTYGYNAVGSLSSVEHGNGNYSKYNYDSLNRLTNLTNWQSSAMSTALSSYQYYLAADGMRTGATETTAAGTTQISWTYDNLNRLITEDYNDADDANDFMHDYAYDIVGNSLTKTVHDVNDNLNYYNNNEQP